MAGRKKSSGKRPARKRSSGTNVVPFVPKERNWIDDQITLQANQKAHIVEALSRYKIVLDEANEADSYFNFHIEHSLLPTLGIINPYNLRQDTESRRSVENVVSAMDALKEAILDCLEQAERTCDESAVNVARRFVKNVAPLHDLNPDDNEPKPIFQDLAEVVNRLDDSADRALKVGVPPRKGDGKQDPVYASFVWRLREIWSAKRPDASGYYRSGGTWKGPFVEMIKECESVLPDKCRPKSDDARGKRLATIFGWMGPTKRK